MKKERFRLIFYGETDPHRKISDIASELAQIYKSDSSKIEMHFFGKTPVIIKDYQDLVAAQKAKDIFMKIGMMCSIEEIPGNNSSTSTPSLQNSTQLYKIVFSGQIADGSEIKAVKQSIASLYKVSLERCEHFFTGKTITIKENVDLLTAQKYQKRFKQIGALCQIIEMETVENTPKKKQSIEQTTLSTSPSEYTPKYYNIKNRNPLYGGIRTISIGDFFTQKELRKYSEMVIAYADMKGYASLIQAYKKKASYREELSRMVEHDTIYIAKKLHEFMLKHRGCNKKEFLSQWFGN